MLKQGTFINRKFDKMLLGCIWGSLAYGVNLMTDSIISGNVLGETSLQAVSIVYPLFSIVYFVAYFIAPGAGVLFGKLIGEFNKEEASRVTGTTFISTTIVGILLSVVLWLAKMPFLTYYGCTGQLLIEASSYYNWLILFALTASLTIPLYFFTVTDGEAVLVSVANTSEIVANVVLSIVLSSRFGISGLGMATCIGNICAMVSYLPHFFKKTNNVKFHFCLDFKYLIRSIYLSSSYYLYYIYLAVVDIVLNKIIIMSCGVELLPAYAVVNLIFGFCEIFESLTTSSMGLITCFLGERNSHDMNLVFRILGRSMVIMSVFVWALFFFGAPLMPRLFGLETAETIDAAILASRIVSFAVLGYGVDYVNGNTLYAIEKPLLSCLNSVMCDAIMPLLCSLLAGSLWGFTGIIIGMTFSPYMAFLAYALIIIPIKGKKGFPLYFETEDEEGVSFDLYVTKESIPVIRDWVCRQLTEYGFNIENIEILIEEFYTRVLEKNPDKRVLSECTLLFSKNRVRIIVRDDGVIFNFMDENNKVESINAHVLNSLLEQTKGKEYLVTAAFNRDCFVFER